MRKYNWGSSNTNVTSRKICKVGLGIFHSLRQKKEFALIIFLLPIFKTYAWDNNTVGSEIMFSGFIKYELFADTRQTVNAREGLVVLYPEDIFYDANGNDVNAVPSINMLSIHSRLRCNITGPVLLGARSKGLVEADFYGNENNYFSDLNGLRLFNAYIKFNWEKTEILAGQDRHPMSIAGFFPGVVSFSAGAPFHPMSRNPQIRIIQIVGELKIIGCMLSQRDFTSTGPDGSGSQYLRNSGIPNLHFQVQFGIDSSNFVGGAGLDYKKIVPELFTINGDSEIFATQNSLPGISIMGFLDAKTKPLSFKVQGVYAQNAYDMTMLGGYATKDVINVQTGEKEFSNVNTASVWTDIQTNGEKIFAGLFCGYSKNLGSGELIDGPLYGRGADIGSLYRISPRVVYTSGPLGISLESEYTAAYYGTANGDMKGSVTDTYPVSNFRTLLSLKYSFNDLIY